MTRLQLRSTMIVVLVVFLLLAIPRTRWIVKTNLADLMGRTSISVSDIQPSTYDDRLAVAMYTPIAQGSNVADTDVLASLAPFHGLTTRYSDRPSAFANALRWDARYHFHILDSPETQAMTQGNGPKPFETFASLPPEFYRQFDDQAVAGERLDPTNGYFPVMRAVGLLSVGTGTQALAELHRAARCAQWNEYMSDELQGEWSLSDRQLGGNSGFSNFFSTYTLQFPQYTLIRSCALIAVARAIALEQAGHAKEGLQIRLDLLRIGATMRRQSQTVTGSGTGLFIDNIGIARPAGAPLVNLDRRTDPKGDASFQQEVTAFENYCGITGNSGLIAPVGVEMASAAKTGMIFNAASAKNEAPVDLSKHESFSLSIGVILLQNAFWLLVVTVLLSMALPIQRTSWMRANLSARVLVTLFVALACIWVISLLSNAQISRNPMFADGVVFGVPDTASPFSNIGVDFNPIVFVPVATALLLFLGIIIASWVRSKPVAEQLASGFALIAPPIAAVLTVLYMANVLATARIDTQLDDLAKRIGTNEVAYVLPADTSMPPAPDWQTLPSAFR